MKILQLPDEQGDIDQIAGDICEHQYKEIEAAPLGVVCIHCGHFVGAWE